MESPTPNPMTGLGIVQIEDLGWSADALDRIHELRSARDLLDYMIEKAIEECRAGTPQDRYVDDVEEADGTTRSREASLVRPISWRRIGAALGVSGQTAWQHYRQ